MEPCGIKNPWSTPYPNSELGNRVAWELFQRGMQLSLKKALDVTWHFGLSRGYQPRFDDARGPLATVEVLVFAKFTSATPPTSWAALAQVNLICESNKHLWKPNWSGSNLCVDGVNFFRLEVRYPDGEISLRKDGDPMSVPDDFRQTCSIISWDSYRD